MVNLPLIDPDTMRALTAMRWAIPVMALLSREKGARFAAMANRLGLSRHSLVRCLAHLRDQGWVAPNPGHGHPLRPEYVLAPAGEATGLVCERIMSERERLGLEPQQLPRWGLPLVEGIGPGWARFGDLHSRLDPITPRALSQTIKTMIDIDLVARRLEDRYPPLPLYGLTGRGRDLAEALRG
jgi:DNA-binding HxlR family transcriptional regulator